MPPLVLTLDEETTALIEDKAGGISSKLEARASKRQDLVLALLLLDDPRSGKGQVVTLVKRNLLKSVHELFDKGETP